MESFEQGEKIEYRDRLNDMWFEVNLPAWGWKEFEYRIKPKKQIVTIEKWLCEYCGSYVVVEGNDLNFMRNEMFKKVKLLDTYEVKLP